MPAEIQELKIIKQNQNIDVLCVVNGIYAVLIEDKTGSSESGDQLARYYKTVLKNFLNPEYILQIYFKTKEQSSYSNVRTCAYEVFGRKELLRAYPIIHLS